MTILKNYNNKLKIYSKYNKNKINKQNNNFKMSKCKYHKLNKILIL